MDEETKNAILQPLKTAEDKAIKKARRNGESEEETPDAPEETPVEIDEAKAVSEDDANPAADNSATLS